MTNAPARILIVGAGAMGIVMGHVLQQGGTRIAYLVRPNRVEELSRPQRLYSYDDHALFEYSGYDIIANPAAIARDLYDFIVFTIDGTALRSAEGQALVVTVGEIAQGTATRVLIGTMGIDLRAGFLRVSGLAKEQVFNGCFFILAYQATRAKLPVHPPTRGELLAQADFAFRQSGSVGFFIDDSAPEAARRFAEIWGASGRSDCMIWSAETFSTEVPGVFPLFVACDIMGWPSWTELAKDRALWDLAAAATREIQGLAMNGATGRQAQARTTADSLIEKWRLLEEVTMPADLLEFNRFHHGGKVYRQDVELLEDCVALGEREGKPMTALRQLIERSHAAHPDG